MCIGMEEDVSHAFSKLKEVCCGYTLEKKMGVCQMWRDEAKNVNKTHIMQRFIEEFK